MRRLLSPILVLIAAAGAACSVHSLDYLSSGYTPDPPLPPEMPGDPPPRDAGSSPDVPASIQTPPAPPPPDAAPALDQARPADVADAAPQPDTIDAPPPPEVFFIVGASPLSPGDAVIERHLRAQGLRVVPVVDEVLASVDTGRASLVLISSSVSVMNVGARFRDVAKPVVVAEPLLYDDMGMVQSMVGMGVNRGIEMNVTTLSIVDATHPLAASLRGNVVIARMATTVSWGTPNASGIRVASLFGQASRVALMAYDTGARMPELIAPARRVGLFLSDQSAGVLTTEGFALFDAAIAWALSR
jgi:hypothetical protein